MCSFLEKAFQLNLPYRNTPTSWRLHNIPEQFWSVCNFSAFVYGVCVYLCCGQTPVWLFVWRRLTLPSQIGPQQCVWRKPAHLLLQAESCNPACLSPQCICKLWFVELRFQLPISKPADCVHLTLTMKGMLSLLFIAVEVDFAELINNSLLPH